MGDTLSKALELLPHGPDFRFLDKLTSLEPGRSGSAEYLVKGNEPFLRGHFPGQPMFPGVLLLEAGAQLAGIVAQTDPAMTPLAGLKLTALRAVKITGTARPGQVLMVEARISGRLANLVQTQIKISVDGNVVLQAEVTLSGESPPR